MATMATALQGIINVTHHPGLFVTHDPDLTRAGEGVTDTQASKAGSILD
jgi:hypothetical protein